MVMPECPVETGASSRTLKNPAGEAWTLDRLKKQWARIRDEIALQSEEDTDVFLP